MSAQLPAYMRYVNEVVSRGITPATMEAWLDTMERNASLAELFTVSS